jgi:hypothetical protein
MRDAALGDMRTASRAAPVLQNLDQGQVGGTRTVRSGGHDLNRPRERSVREAAQSISPMATMLPAKARCPGPCLPCSSRRASMVAEAASGAVNGSAVSRYTGAVGAPLAPAMGGPSAPSTVVVGKSKAAFPASIAPAHQRVRVRTRVAFPGSSSRASGGDDGAGPSSSSLGSSPQAGVIGHLLSVFNVYQDPVMNQRLLALIIGQVGRRPGDEDGSLN